MDDIIYSFEELKTFKRNILQKLCKEHKLRATGKNIDLIDRLNEYYLSLNHKENENIQKNNETSIDVTLTPKPKQITNLKHITDSPTSSSEFLIELDSTSDISKSDIIKTPSSVSNIDTRSSRDSPSLHSTCSSFSIELSESESILGSEKTLEDNDLSEILISCSNESKMNQLSKKLSTISIQDESSISQHINDKLEYSIYNNISEESNKTDNINENTQSEQIENETILSEHSINESSKLEDSINENTQSKQIENEIMLSEHSINESFISEKHSNNESSKVEESINESPISEQHSINELSISDKYPINESSISEQHFVNELCISEQHYNNESSKLEEDTAINDNIQSEALNIEKSLTELQLINKSPKEDEQSYLIEDDNTQNIFEESTCINTKIEEESTKSEHLEYEKALTEHSSMIELPSKQIYSNNNESTDQQIVIETESNPIIKEYPTITESKHEINTLESSVHEAEDESTSNVENNDSKEHSISQHLLETEKSEHSTTDYSKQLKDLMLQNEIKDESLIEDNPEINEIENIIKNDLNIEDNIKETEIQENLDNKEDLISTNITSTFMDESFDEIDTEDSMSSNINTQVMLFALNQLDGGVEYSESTSECTTQKEESEENIKEFQTLSLSPTPLPIIHNIDTNHIISPVHIQNEMDNNVNIESHNTNETKESINVIENGFSSTSSPQQNIKYNSLHKNKVQKDTNQVELSKTLDLKTNQDTCNDKILYNLEDNSPTPSDSDSFEDIPIPYDTIEFLYNIQENSIDPFSKNKFSHSTPKTSSSISSGIISPFKSPFVNNKLESYKSKISLIPISDTSEVDMDLDSDPSSIEENIQINEDKYNKSLQNNKTKTPIKDNTNMNKVSETFTPEIEDKEEKVEETTQSNTESPIENNMRISKFSFSISENTKTNLRKLSARAFALRRKSSQLKRPPRISTTTEESLEDSVLSIISNTNKSNSNKSDSVKKPRRTMQSFARSSSTFSNFTVKNKNISTNINKKELSNDKKSGIKLTKPRVTQIKTKESNPIQTTKTISNNIKSSSTLNQTPNTNISNKTNKIPPKSTEVRNRKIRTKSTLPSINKSKDSTKQQNSKNKAITRISNRPKTSNMPNFDAMHEKQFKKQKSIVSINRKNMTRKSTLNTTKDEVNKENTNKNTSQKKIVRKTITKPSNTRTSVITKSRPHIAKYSENKSIERSKQIKKNHNNTLQAKKKKFDLQASLARPLTYKPKKGPIKH